MDDCSPADTQPARSDLERELLTVTARLQATYGAHWERVPTGCGALAVRACEILAAGMVPVDPSAAVPVRLLQDLEPFIRFTTDTAAELLEEMSLLGDALGTDLATMSVAELRLLARAIFQLRDVPAPDPSWSRPQTAASAHVALDAVGDEVRAIAAAHQQLQRDFTDDVWRLPVLQRYGSVDRWWQWKGRRHVRRALGSVSRAGRPTGDVARVLATLHEVMDLRARLDDTWAPLRAHLGWFADTPIPDADGASSALAALQQLQGVLDDRLNPEKLAELAAADAFVAVEITAPAEAIADAIAAWVGLAKRHESADPLAFTVPEIDDWARLTGKSLEVLRFIHEATSPLRPGVRSVAETFDDAIARDRVAQLRRRLGMAEDAEQVGSA